MNHASSTSPNLAEQACPVKKEGAQGAPNFFLDIILAYS
jgi:hypothetical protein